jgi:hypothetical protein
MSAEALEIPLRDCEPWCERGDRHADEHPEDRDCLSTFRPVPLSNHRAVQVVGGAWLDRRVPQAAGRARPAPSTGSAA